MAADAKGPVTPVGVSRAAVWRCVRRAVPYGFAAGRRSLQGDRAERVFVIERGWVLITSVAPGGREIVLALRGPGDLIGAVEATVAPSSAMTRALSDAETAMDLLRVLAARLRDADLKRLEFAALDTMGRVAWRLQELSERFGEQTAEGIEVELPLSQEQLASWCGALLRGSQTGRLRQRTHNHSVNGRGRLGFAARQYRYQPDDQPEATGDSPPRPSRRSKPMSPYLHYEIARARHQEMVAGALNSHRSHAIVRRPSVKHRVVQLVAVIGVCVAAGTGVTVSAAHSNHRPAQQRVVHVSAHQLAREIRTFEAKGYVPTACTVSGTLMRNYTTGRSVTVEW
jgi:CRP/FNR family transcriptional regulator, cyclic AMP receptor protein